MIFHDSKQYTAGCRVEKIKNIELSEIEECPRLDLDNRVFKND